MELSEEKSEILRQQLDISDQKKEIDKQLSQLQHIKSALKTVAAKHEAPGGGSLFNSDTL